MGKRSIRTTTFIGRDDSNRQARRWRWCPSETEHALASQLRVVINPRTALIQNARCAVLRHREKGEGEEGEEGEIDGLHNNILGSCIALEESCQIRRLH
jgi:hypothetical protein